MESRNILNYLGDVIGQLELPEGTSEEVWAEKLAVFAVAPQAAIIPDVTPRQIRQALILTGVSLQQIEDALNSLPEPMRSLAKTEWEYSIAFKRDRSLVAQIATMLNWTPEQLDDLWRFAAGL